MKSFLFRMIELWVALLVFLIGCLGAIGFGVVTLDAERGWDHFGIVGDAALAVAEAPAAISQLLKPHLALAAEKPDRFIGRPGGWTFAEGAPPLSGYVLLSRHDKYSDRPVVELVSLADGVVRYSWWPDADSLLADAPRTSKQSTFIDWTRSRFRAIHPFLMTDGGLVIKDHGTYLMRVDSCARKVWRQDRFLAHHSTESDGAGGFWIPGFIEPHTLENVPPEFAEDALVHVDADGNILSMQSLPQIFLDNGLEWALFTVGRPSDDPLHLNDIQPVLTDGPYWKRGDLFLSLRHISAIVLFRPSTGRIVWMKQGPWLGQHDVDILDERRIGIFDNHAHDRGLGVGVDGANRIAIYDFSTDEVSGPWNETLDRLEVQTRTEGLFEVLPNGGIMVEEGDYGRLLFLDEAGNELASYLNKGSDGLSYLMGWSRRIDQVYGDKVLAMLNSAACNP